MSKHQDLKSYIETDLEDWIKLKKKQITEPTHYYDVYHLTNMAHIDMMAERKKRKLDPQESDFGPRRDEGGY